MAYPILFNRSPIRFGLFESAADVMGTFQRVFDRVMSREFYDWCAVGP